MQLEQRRGITALANIERDRIIAANKGEWTHGRV